MKKTPRFSSTNKVQFFSSLKKRVDEYFKNNNLSKTADTEMLVKTLAMFMLYFLPYALILTGWFSMPAMALLVLVMAFGKAGIGMSVMHDANHGAYSNKKWVNHFMGNTLYMLGSSPHVWKIKHNTLHHTYTNIYELDEDIENKAVLRLSPHSEFKPFHRYQYIYAFPLYGLMTLSIIFKDIVKIFQYHQDGLSKSGSTIFVDVLKIVVTKAMYLFFILYVPYAVLDISFWAILTGFFMLHFVTGLILSVVFQLAHLVEETAHYGSGAGEDIENTWAIHQLSTTANFSPKNRFLNWYLGGLNYQVEHHLFPNICHVHYEKLSDIVKQTALEYDVPYHQHSTFFDAVRSHFLMLKRLGHAA